MSDISHACPRCNGPVYWREYCPGAYCRKCDEYWVDPPESATVPIREELDAAYNKLAASEQTRKHLEATIDATEEAVIDLREELSAAKLAGKVFSGMLETLQAETADLIEMRRCQESIIATGWGWERHSRPYPNEGFESHIVAGPEAGWPIHLSTDVHTACNSRTYSTWQSAERAAWNHAAAPYRDRIEETGFRLDLHFGGALYPIIVTAVGRKGSPMTRCGEQGFGEPGGYPTLELLETAAQWSEARAEKTQATHLTCDLCGQEHDGCDLCGYLDLQAHQWPCADCHGTEENGAHNLPCRYTANVPLCKQCGKLRRDNA